MTNHRWRAGWDHPMESGLVVVVQEANPIVGSVRDRFDPYAGVGVPPHITILYPFFTPSQITPDVTNAIREVASHASPFDFELSVVESFPGGAIYLTPSPASRFVDLTSRLFARFPEHPPFGGEFDDIVPHLTVGWIDEGAALPAVSAAMAGRFSDPVYRSRDHLDG